MKIEYKEDTRPGYGKLIFSEAIIPEEPWKISIQRGSDKQFLSPEAKNPWVGASFFIELAGAGQADGSLALEVGPDIVDRLDQQEVYRLGLKGADGEPQKAQLRVASINYTPGGSLDNTADISIETREPEPVAKPEPRPEPKPEPKTGPIPEKLEFEGAKPAAKSGRSLWRWALLGVLLLACLAWYWLDQRKKEEPAAETPQVAEQPKAAPQQEQSVEEQVRQFFGGGRMSPGQAMELARKLRSAAPDEQDAIYRLYYFAAQNGEPSALFAYASCLDPSKPAWGTIEKSAPEAWNYYKKSPDQEKAAAAMTQMREWLEEKSRAGDAQAAAWLKEIEQ